MSMEVGGMAEAGSRSSRNLAMMDGYRAHTEERCSSTVAAATGSRTTVSSTAASGRAGSDRMSMRPMSWQTAKDLGEWASLEARQGRTKDTGEEQGLKAIVVGIGVDSDDQKEPW